jgi:outer membrane protein TolC
LRSGQELFSKFQLSFPFNLGFTAVNTLKSAESDAVAANRRIGESRTLVEQQVYDAWANLDTVKKALQFLRNQSSIAEEFLELARKEQKLGNRTLLDVLAGETTLFNANSDAASAETDVAITVYTPLNAMGRLTEKTIVDR